VDDADKAHAVGLALLPYARELIEGATPNHLIEGPCPGVGKGLLADAVLRPATGRNIGILTQAKNDDEWRKRLTACFRESRPVMLLDNVTYPLDSGVLAAALTAQTWDDRLLGKNETGSFPVRCVWVTTATNPTLSTEIARRSIRIRLDPKQDRPWLREGFNHPNLGEWVDEHRGELVWAALTLIQAWLVAGRPASTHKPLGSYESWSFVIGGILEHAGIPGFLGNLLEFYERADLEGAAWREFVQRWWEEFQDQPVGTAELYPLAEEIDGIPLGRGKEEKAKKTALGKQLAKQRDRVIGDYRVTPAGEKQRASQWQLSCVGKNRNPESERGEPK